MYSYTIKKAWAHMEKTAVTQKFIANAAGVSQKTVSLFLKGDRRISEKTREKLLRVMKDHRYLPNMSAISMKEGHFRRIACVILGNQAPLSPHFTGYINGATEALSERGYSLILESFKLDWPEEQFTRPPAFFKSLSVDGVIGIPGGNVPEPVDQLIREMGVPTVWLNRKSSKPDILCFRFDEAKGAAALTKHLIEKGKRRIAWFGPRQSEWEFPTHYSHEDRLASVEATLRESGLALHSKSIQKEGWNLSASATQAFEGESLPDALICYDFRFYNAAYHVAAAKGLAERAVELVHFASDWEHVPFIQDFQTYVHIPEFQMGRLGAQCLCAWIDGKELGNVPSVLEGALHVGKTVDEDIEAGRSS